MLLECMLKMLPESILITLIIGAIIIFILKLLQELTADHEL